MAPTPDIVVSRHPDLGITATNPRQLPIIDLLLHRVGFTHHPDHGLYALTDPEREPTRRTQQALRALRATTFTVTAPDFDAAPPQPAKPGPHHAQRGLLTPDVAFGLHPDLGVVAATRGAQPRAGQILTEYGFRHLPRFDLHTLPPGTEPRETAPLVAAASRVLHDAGLTVTADPAITLPTNSGQQPSPAPAPRHDNTTTRALRDLTTQLHHAERGKQVTEAIDAVLDDRDGPLGALHQFTHTTATWCERLETQRGNELATHLHRAADLLERIGNDLADIGEELRRTRPVAPADARNLADHPQRPHPNPPARYGTRAKAAAETSPHQPTTTPGAPAASPAPRPAAVPPAPPRTR